MILERLAWRLPDAIVAGLVNRWAIAIGAVLLAAFVYWAGWWAVGAIAVAVAGAAVNLLWCARQMPWRLW